MDFDTRRQIASPTGASLNLYVSRPDGAPRGIVQINHGLAEHAARYARFANFLAAQGFATYAHDHRGHGYTTAPDAPRGSFGKKPAAATVLADVLAIHDLIAKKHPGRPVIVFGHSMGSLIAANFMLGHSQRVAGAAIWNGNFSAGLLGRLAQVILGWEQFRRGSDTPSHLLPKLTFDQWAKQASDGRTSFDWLSRDHEAVDAYMADPLCGWSPSVGMWQTVFDFIFAGADDRNFASIRKDFPVHLVGGSGDPESQFGKAVEMLATRMKRMGFSDVVTTIYPETRHESLNELNRDVIMEDFCRWAMRLTGS